MFRRIKMILDRLVSYLLDDYWDLAIIDNDISEIINGNPLVFKYIKNPYHKERWFADPFILNVDDNSIFLLVEDFFYSDRKGRISEIRIDRKTYQVKEVHIILELDSHLSFPAIFRENGHIYMYPENSQANGLWLYEYIPEKYECKKVSQLCNQPLTDAIITDKLGKKLILSTQEPNPNMNVLDVYEWDAKLGLYIKCKSITFEENVARNAGDIFEYNGFIYRPAQECNDIYGHAVSLQEICLDNRFIRFKEIRRLSPESKSRKIGLHTFNSYSGVIVTDVRGFRFKNIASVLWKMKTILKK